MIICCLYNMVFKFKKSINILKIIERKMKYLVLLNIKELVWLF